MLFGRLFADLSAEKQGPAIFLTLSLKVRKAVLELDMASNFKSSPALNENFVYEQWKKEIAIWQAFTNLSAEKQDPAIFLTLSGKAREAVLELDVSKLTDKDEVKNVISKLDTL